MLVILLVALLVLGPNKLPGAARQVGKVLGELRRMSSGFQAEMRDAMREPVEGVPSSGSTTAKAGGALTSPAASEATPPPLATSVDATEAGDGTETAVASTPPAGADDGSDDEGDAGITGAPAKRGGTATSRPASDPGSNGSTST